MMNLSREKTKQIEPHLKYWWQVMKVSFMFIIFYKYTLNVANYSENVDIVYEQLPETKVIFYQLLLTMPVYETLDKLTTV